MTELKSQTYINSVIETAYIVYFQEILSLLSIVV